MNEWKAILGSGVRWAPTVLLAGWAAMLVLYLVGAAVQVPSFRIALGPLPVLDWVYAVEPGVGGTFGAAMGVGWFVLAAVIGAARVAWLRLGPWRARGRAA